MKTTQLISFFLVIAFAMMTSSYPTINIYTTPDIKHDAETKIKENKLIASVPPSYQLIEDEVRTQKIQNKIAKEAKAKANNNCADHWQQCGGIGFTGPTCCKSNLKCHEYNPWYSQCI